MSIVLNNEKAEKFNLTGEIYTNLSVSKLVEHSLINNEGMLSQEGALCVTTGKYTGRSPNDKFIVKNEGVEDTIDWTSNQPLSPDKFEKILDKLKTYLEDKKLYVFDGFAGADDNNKLPIRVINEYAWQNLFVHQLFIRPDEEELAKHIPQFTVVCAPNFRVDTKEDGTNSETIIAISFEHNMVIIGGTHYAGEMKKSIFSVMNYILPDRDVLPMHCSSNIGAKGDVSLFFGLSGTGKTTLSADENRQLIGDDEHGWSKKGVFNFEGGCYAKCIGLSKEKEPQIWNAIRYGTVLENVVLDNKRNADFLDNKLTENTRAAYPIDYIPNSVEPSIGGHPEIIFFLTADAFGVLPPISKLSRDQAMYYFLSGYTSKLAGTERGITKPEATFSACFGAPFLPRPPHVYAEMLGEKIDAHQAKVYLVNTGWTGGEVGIGNRISLKFTRSMINHAISGELENVEYITDPIFKLRVPKSCPNVPSDILLPRNTWADKSGYDKKAKELATMFHEYFKVFPHVPANIIDAGPSM